MIRLAKTGRAKIRYLLVTRYARPAPSMCMEKGNMTALKLEAVRMDDSRVS